MRPILPYRTPLRVVPTTGQAVWIRRLQFYDTPVRAVCTSADGVDVDVRQAASPFGLVAYHVPWTAISSWKFQFLADETDYRDARLSYWPP